VGALVSRLSRASGRMLRGAGFVLVAAAAVACNQVAPGVRVPNVVQVQRFPALEKASRQVSSVAVVPFDARARGELRTTEGPGRAAAPVVTRQLAEALQAQGVSVVPPEDVGRALSAAGIDPRSAGLPRVAAVVAQKFGSNMMVTGRVVRWRDKEGERLGASNPASVAFDVLLWSAPGAVKLWEATFDETQQPLSSNVFNAGRYPGGGTRWLSADELSKWGASGVAKAFPVQPASRPAVAGP